LAWIFLTWRFWLAEWATVAAMTDRQEEPGIWAGRPISTGEFRATPDVSASTAQFQAFAENEAEPERPWNMAAPGRSVAKMALLIVVVAVVLAAIAILIVH
jgi:hypothetical protein